MKWTAGKAGDSLANLVGHFVKHGAEFGAKNVDEYYGLANQFISSKNYKWVDYYGDTVHYDPVTKIRAITTKEGEIKTFHVLDDPETIAKCDQKVSEINNLTK
jgi:pyocin large subunit-like protein